MSSVSQRPVSKRSSTTIFYTLAIGSGVMRAFSVAFDVFGLNVLAIDPLVYGFLSQWVSFAVTLSIVLILSIRHVSAGRKRSLGYHLDPDFDRLKLLPRKPMVYIALAGFFAGISTLAYYLLIGGSDAATVLPYGQLVIIYLLIGDLVGEKDTPTIVEVQSIMSILFGVLLIGAEPGGFDLVSLLIVLLPLNLSSAFVTYFQRKTKRHETRPGLRVDSLNMRLWSLLILNSAMSILSLPMLTNDWVGVMVSSIAPLSMMMIGSSVATFLSIVLYIQALGKGSMSVVNSLSAVSVVFGIPVTLIAGFMGVAVVTGDVFLWTLKVLGVILVVVGVVALQSSEVRSMVLIKVKPLTGDLLPDLFAIKGVEKASALAGTHDYVLTIKSRNLAKTRTKILRRIHMVEGIADVETLVVIRDYR
ncbi:Lrp/AsnC family transcriptional regulator [Candidatus Thorarchaeota archaeon]|nr:MAG: Lrp/AsnC family transcriptional regulator [Candidatus Thorarchaeota archaeon]